MTRDEAIKKISHRGECFAKTLVDDLIDLGLFTPDEPPKKKTPIEKFFVALTENGITLYDYQGFLIVDADFLKNFLKDEGLAIVDKGER